MPQPSLNFQSAQLRSIAEYPGLQLQQMCARHVLNMVTDGIPLIINHLTYQLNYDVCIFKLFEKFEHF